MVLKGLLGAIFVASVPSPSTDPSPPQYYANAVVESTNVVARPSGHFRASGGAGCRGRIYLVLVYASKQGNVQEAEVRVNAIPRGESATWSARLAVPNDAEAGPAVLYATTSCGREEQSDDVPVTIIPRTSQPVAAEHSQQRISPASPAPFDTPEPTALATQVSAVQEGEQGRPKVSLLWLMGAAAVSAAAMIYAGIILRRS